MLTGNGRGIRRPMIDEMEPNAAMHEGILPQPCPTLCVLEASSSSAIRRSYPPQNALCMQRMVERQGPAVARSICHHQTCGIWGGQPR